MADSVSISSASLTSAGTMTPCSLPMDGVETLAREYWKERWNEALEISRKYLHPKTFDDLKQCDTCEKLLEDLSKRASAYSNRTIPLLLQRVAPALGPLRNLTNVLVLVIRGNTVAVAAVWGVIHLLIQSAITSVTVLTQIVEMLEELGHQLHIFELYLPVGFLPERNDAVGNAIVEVFADNIKFWSKAVATLSKNPIELAMQNIWNHSISQDLKKTFERIKRNVDRIKETASATMYRMQFMSKEQFSQVDILRSLESLRVTDSLLQKSAMNEDKESDALRECHHIGFPENTQFFPREDILAAMRSELTHEPKSRRFRSMTLWGIGGVGKTQLALAYAYERQRHGLQLIFWINSEDKDNLMQSCSEISAQLKLKGTVPAGQHERNQALLVKWLRETNIDFLMIFDNVEEMSIIKDTWVISHHGSILVTTRHDFASVWPVNMILHVPFMTEEQGSQFFMKISQQTSSEEFIVESGRKLSELLGGLPLALTIMAMQARRRRMSIPRFLTFYKENETRLHGSDKKISLEPFYHHDLTTAYRLSFQSLDESSAVLLRIISLLNPVDIPVKLFHPENIEALPNILSFCHDTWQFEESLDALLTSSLIRRDPSSDTVSLHRVIQLEFRNTMDVETRKLAVKVSSTLLLEAFPKQVNGLSLRNEWTRCTMYIQHVLSLTKHYEEFKLFPQYPGEFQHLAECLSNAAWYLMESGSWDRCEELLKTAFRACDDKDSVLYAHLLNTAAYLRDKRNQSKEALELYKVSKKIREARLGPLHEELANTYNNMGLALESCCQFTEALDCYQKAIQIDLLKPETERNKILHIRHLNMGSVYTNLKQYTEAQSHIETGRQYAIKTFGKETYYESIADYQLAEIFYKEGNYCEAKLRLDRALVIQRRQNELHPTTGASLFKLACIELKDGLVDEAEIHLQEALLIAQYNVPHKGDQGDVARIQRKLAELHFRKGRDDEGANLLRRAEEVRKELQGPEWESSGDSEWSYNLLVSCYYR